MRRGAFISLILLLVSACAPWEKTVQVSELCQRGPADFSPVQEQIDALLEQGQFASMAVGVACDGEIFWEDGFGLAQRDAGIPADENTIYPLASISKPLTASALMLLVERGQVDLQAPINDYLSEAKLEPHLGDLTQATVARVASHTAGLPLHANHYFSGEPDPPPLAITIADYGYLFTPPGERFQYSNLGYGLLGELIANVSGQPYAEFISDELFIPLGMTHTSVGIPPAEMHSQLAAKYTLQGVLVPYCKADCPAASDLYSSVHDLLRFAVFQLKGDLAGMQPPLSPTTIDQMQQPAPNTGPMRAWQAQGSGYGIGWKVGLSTNGLRVIYHDGGTSGVSHILALLPEHRLAVVLLSNTNSQWPERLLLEILGIFLPDEVDSLAVAIPDEQDAAPVNLPEGYYGKWQGWVSTNQGEFPFYLEIEDDGVMQAGLDGQPLTRLQQVSFQEDFPLFMNSGGGPYLRGWMAGGMQIPDLQRGKPQKLWLELRLRGDTLNGALISFSQRQFPTGPLSHWVILKRP